MDFREGARRIDKLRHELEDGSDVAEAYAEALGAQARRNASRRPTPQAPLAAQALTVRGAELLVPRSATVRSSTGSLSAGRVAGGSEWGSTLYRQFGPRRSSGSWIGAAAERPDSSTIEAGQSAIDELIRDAVR